MAELKSVIANNQMHDQLTMQVKSLDSNPRAQSLPLKGMHISKNYRHNVSQKQKQI